jgi:hypothetical protein
MKTPTQKFTKRQIANWKEYEAVRAEGLYNMFDPNAQLATGLDRDDYMFSLKNYSALKEAAADE